MIKLFSNLLTIAIFFTLLLRVNTFAQSNSTKEIEQSAMQFKKKLLAQVDESPSSIEIAFMVDTFQIMEKLRLYQDDNYSTSGMNQSVNAAANSYNVLLNKYYKFLLNVLDKDDRKALVEAERAWVTFKDKEDYLYSILRKEEYSGGGTIQSNFYVGHHFDVIEQRTLELYHYYIEITSNAESKHTAPK